MPDKKKCNILTKQKIFQMSNQGLRRKGQKGWNGDWPESAAKKDVDPDHGYCPGWPFLLSSSGSLQLFFLSLATARGPQAAHLSSCSPSLPHLCQHCCLFHVTHHLPHPSAQSLVHPSIFSTSSCSVVVTLLLGSWPHSSA